MTARSCSFALPVLGLAWLAACSKPSAPTPARGGPSASVSASPQSAASAEPTVPHTVQVKPGCRALVVAGQVAVDGASVVVGTLLDGEHWVELAAGASVALRHTSTSREFKLIGPGKVLPCRAGSEQILLAEGQLTTSANLGVRPGAEVLIATPAGTVRYGDAALDLEFGASKELRVRVKQGEAWVEPEEQGSPHFKNPVRSGGEARLAPQHDSAVALIAACQASAEAAQESARRVLDTSAAGAAGSLGARAATQMRDRSKARVRCAVAAAAAFATADPAERQSLSASVAHADALWQSVPLAASGQKN